MHKFDTKKWSAYWETGLRTVQNWARAEYPVTDKHAMAQLIIEKNLGGAKCREKAGRIVLEQDGRLESKNDSVEPSSSLGQGKGALIPGVDDVDVRDIDLKKASIWAWEKMQEASRKNDQVGVSYWHDRFLKNEDAVRRAETHALKMGVGDGEIITREVFSKLSYGLAFWLVRSVEVEQKRLGMDLEGIDILEVRYEIIERFFMRTRFLKSFTKAVDQMSGVSLPRWFLDELNAGVEAFFECDRLDKSDVEAWDEYQAALSRSRKEAVHA